MLIFPLASGTYLALHDTYCFCLFFFLPFFFLFGILFSMEILSSIVIILNIALKFDLS